MALKEALIAELKHETSLSRKMLERVPMDKKEWKPHEKSMTLGRLATHIAETVAWVSNIRHIDDFDFLKDFKMQFHTASSGEELLQTLDRNVQNALADLAEMTDADFDALWTVRRGEQVMMQMPKKVAIRGWAFSHQIHHRGQLSVYLRQLDVPVPGMYGPSADER